MAKLTASQVEHVAKLANLPITTKETSQFQKQLSEIVGYVGKIQKAGTPESAKFKIQKLKMGSKDQTTREDMVKPEDCLTQEEAVSNAKNIHNGLFVAAHVFAEK